MSRDKIRAIAFWDIETAPLTKHIEDAPDHVRRDIIKRYNRAKNESIKSWQIAVDVGRVEDLQSFYRDTAALRPETGRVVAVAIVAHYEDGPPEEWVYCSRDEKALIARVFGILQKFNRHAYHNGVDFDVPFICRRALYLGLRDVIPESIHQSGRKPWERTNIDTMDKLGFGQWKPKVNLDMFCSWMGLESPKDIMTGDQVGEYFYSGESEKVDTVKEYCLADVHQMRLAAIKAGFVVFENNLFNTES